MTATALATGAPRSHRAVHWVAQHHVRGVGHLWRIAERVATIPGTAGLRVGEHTLALDLSEDAERRMYTGVYERSEFEVLAALVRPGGSCIDAGANIGLVTVLLAGLVGSRGRVLALEPSPLVLDRLRATTAALDHVTVVATAVGDSPGELPLDVSGATHAHATLRGGGLTAGGPKAVVVPVARLDDLARAHGFDAVDLLKVDVEGWEKPVLDGAGELLANGRVGAVLFEANPQWGPVPDVDALRAHGYRVFRIASVSRGPVWRTVLIECAGALPDHQTNVVAVRHDRVGRVARLLRR